MWSTWIVLWLACIGPALGQNWLDWMSNGYIGNLFRGNDAEVVGISGMYDTLCARQDTTVPYGSCVNLATCLFSGGTVEVDRSNCGVLEGSCCTHRLSCGDTMVSRVAYWESKGYPQLSTVTGGCSLTVTPTRGACYIRVEFEDTILTSPRPETCEGNTLSITGQAEGSGGLLCGNLNGHETFIRVVEGMTSVFRVYDDVVLHMDVLDTYHKYKMKLTQIKCEDIKHSPISLARRGRALGLSSAYFNHNSSHIPEENVDFRRMQLQNTNRLQNSLHDGRNKDLSDHATDKFNDNEQYYFNRILEQNEAAESKINPLDSFDFPFDSTLRDEERQASWQWWQNLMMMPSVSLRLAFGSSTEAPYVQPLKLDPNPNERCGSRKSGGCKNRKDAEENLGTTTTTTTPTTSSPSRITTHRSVSTKNIQSSNSPIRNIAGSTYIHSSLTVRDKADKDDELIGYIINPQVSASGISNNNRKIPSHLTVNRHKEQINLPTKAIYTQLFLRNPLTSQTLMNNHRFNNNNHNSAFIGVHNRNNRSQNKHRINGRVVTIQRSDDIDKNKKNSQSKRGSVKIIESHPQNKQASNIKHSAIEKSSDELSNLRSPPRDLVNRLASDISNDNLPAAARRVMNSRLTVIKNFDNLVSTNQKQFIPISNKPKSDRQMTTRPANQFFANTRVVGIKANNSRVGGIDKKILDLLSIKSENPQNKFSSVSGNKKWSMNMPNNENKWVPPFKQQQGSSGTNDVYEIALRDVISRMPQHNLERTAAELLKGQNHGITTVDSLLRKELSNLILKEIQARVINRNSYNSGGAEFQVDTGHGNGFMVMVSPIRSGTSSSLSNFVNSNIDGDRHNEELKNLLNINANTLRGESINSNLFSSNLFTSNTNSNANVGSSSTLTKTITTIKPSMRPAIQLDPKSPPIKRVQRPSHPTLSGDDLEATYYGYMILHNEMDEYFLCSVTLISPRHVLTAASCVMRKGFDSDSYKARVIFNNEDLGPANTRTGEQLFNQREAIRVKKMTFHPMYKHGFFHFDVAVLELKEVVEGSKPIKIAMPETDLKTKDVTLMGHGVRPTERLNFAAYEQHVSYIDGKVIYNDDCAEQYSVSLHKRFAYFEELIKEDLLCIKSSGGMQLCEGDQGGPVVINFMDPTSEPLLVGVAAGNDNNCVGVERSALGVFPDVAVRLTTDILAFIETATADIRFEMQ